MRRQTTVLWFIILFAVGSMIMAVLVLYKWNKPLGPGLGLPTYTPGIVSNAQVAATSAEPVSPVTDVISSTQSARQSGPNIPEPSATPGSQPLCNGPKTMTVLAIGSDQRAPGYMYGLADSIHVVRIDFTVPNIMVIDFPRDLWVEIPGIADHHGITHGKLNQAYFYGNPGMGYYDGPGEGPGLLARTLDLNVGLRVDHYIAVDTQTFVHIIDAVGGIDITLDSPIDLSNGIVNANPKYFLSVGTHHLDGEMAYRLATIRIPSTFQRMEHQKIVLAALREKLLRPEMLPKIPKLISQFISTVQTDFSPREINSLICIAQAVPEDHILMDSFPQEMFTASNIYDANRGSYTFIYEVDFDKLRLMVAEFMSGIWPMPNR